MLKYFQLGATSLLLIGCILLGSTLGHFWPESGPWLGQHVDLTLLVLITLLFFGVRFEAIKGIVGKLPFIGIALVANFLIIPVLGYLIALCLPGMHSLIMLGLVVYFMSPCTDWFLGFTKMAKGNVALGSALLPINMVVQLLLYPFYLQLFGSHLVELDAGMISDTLLNWFLVPLAIGLAAHLCLRFILNNQLFELLLRWADHAMVALIAFLVLEIFAANIQVIVANQHYFGWLLLAVFVFFLVTYLLAEGLSHLLKLPYGDHALLTMTTAARNAPLMLAITMVAIPDQPLIYAAIVIGMLLEFPHLTMLRHMLLTKHAPAVTSLEQTIKETIQRKVTE